MQTKTDKTLIHFHLEKTKTEYLKWKLLPTPIFIQSFVVFE